MIIEIKYKKQICEVGKRIYEKGYVAANNGNISIRIGENEVLITPNGVSKGALTTDMIVKVDLDGTVLEGEGNFQPTLEMFAHLQIYKERPDIESVLHVHPPFATAFAVAGIPLDQAIMPDSVVYLGTIPIAEYGTPLTGEIPEAIKKYVHRYQGVLLENHGALTWGKDLDHALFLMEYLEFTAKVNWIAKQINGDRELSTQNVERLLEIKSNMNIKGESPLGIETPLAVHAMKVSSHHHNPLTTNDIDIIVEKVTKGVLQALKNQ